MTHIHAVQDPEPSHTPARGVLILGMGLIVAVLLALTSVMPAHARPAEHQRIVRLHHRIDALRQRVSRLRIENRRLRSELTAKRGLPTIDRVTVTYHMPATEAPDGKWQCAELTDTNDARVSAITVPLSSLIRGSTSIVVNHADGSTLTYTYDQAEQPYNPCSDPFAAQ